MKKLVLIPLLFLIVTGCTGTKVKVIPDPGSFQSRYWPQDAYSSLGLRDVSTAGGNLTDTFANEMRQAGFVKDLYYPARPDDNVELVLDSQFDITVEPNMGSNFTKSFFTGLTLFLLEPVFWYHFEFTLTGDVTIYRDGKYVNTVSAKSYAIMSMKWLSLGHAATLQKESLERAKQSLYRQLMEKIQKTDSDRRKAPNKSFWP